MLGMQSRRSFVAAVSSAGIAGLVGTSRRATAEPPPETTKLRVHHSLASVSPLSMSLRSSSVAKGSPRYSTSHTSSPAGYMKA
jgi:hypothetical protein